MKTLEPYFLYWGKASASGVEDAPAFHLLPFHSLDVAAVGFNILNAHGQMRESLSVLVGMPEPEFLRWSVFLLAMHDLGKFATSFQALKPELLETLQQRKTNTPYIVRHDSLGDRLWNTNIKAKLQEIGLLKPSSKRSGPQAVDYWMMAMTGHHGQPPKPTEQGFWFDDHFHECDQQAASLFAEHLIDVLLGDEQAFPNVDKKNIKIASWWLAGFAVLCDWLGSNTNYFPYSEKPIDLSDYWNLALRRAASAVADVELLPANPSRSLDLSQIIGVNSLVEPTPLQSAVAELALNAKPRLFILEDVTGAGKTEAAILLAHRLIAAGLGNGVYIGLPTMATANAMYERLGNVYRNLYAADTKPSLILAHGARNLSATFRQSLMPEIPLVEKEYASDEAPPAGIHCSQWMADSRKKALLAEIGVGTIDQALLGILSSRHQSLRLLGLMGKVLVVDEVHACDAYMRPLVCNLLKAHAMAGGSAILLSATLPSSHRQELLDGYAHGLNKPSPLLKSWDYPLLTHFDGADLIETHVTTRDSVKRNVKVDFVDSFDAVEAKLATIIAAGQCACWIRNTVGDAREAYSELKSRHPDWEIDLFHARFALADRLTIESRVVKHFGKTSGAAFRSGRVLIATQVVEQSLDLDFDHLITDLAPVDLIIQRAGRLHRHRRDTDGNRVEGSEGSGADERLKPVLVINAPAWSDDPDAQWFKASFPKVQSVYPNHGQLWLTMKLLRDKGGFAMPGDARSLIEGVYGDDIDPPEGLWEASSRADGENRAKASVAILNRLTLESGYSMADAVNWWDDTKTPTRLGEETTTIWLTRWENGELKPFHNSPPFAWQQSSLSIRTALIAEAAPDASIPEEAIALCRETLPAKGKWGVLLPLVFSDDGEWQGGVKDGRGKLEVYRYQIDIGLTEKGC